jgi:hypothetical protein
MDLGSLRALTTSIIFGTLSVDATVTRPSPDNVAIVTRGIWTTPVTESLPSGLDFKHAEPLRRMALPRLDVPTVPRGTLIAAAERDGADVLTWQVDSIDHVDAYYTRVFVVQVPEAN